MERRYVRLDGKDRIKGKAAVRSSNLKFLKIR